MSSESSGDADGVVVESRSGSIVRSAMVGGRDVMIKISPRDDRAERELAVYAELDLPVPTPPLHDSTVSADEIALVLERWEPPPPASQWTEAKWVALAYALARLHAYIPPDPDRWTRTEPVDSIDVDGLWAADRDWLARLDRAELEAAVGTELVFSHGDCHLANVVFDDHGTLGLVDWQSARMAPACADLAFALTRAAATGAVVPRRLVICRYAASRGLDPAAFDRAVTAQQLLTLVWQYPAFASYLSVSEVDRLRATLHTLAAHWLAF